MEKESDEERRARAERAASTEDEGPKSEDEEVDEASEDSFPASDPPSY